MAAFVAGGVVDAEVMPADGAQPLWQLDRDSDALYLSARIPLELPASLTDALHRGVPLHFVWRAELRRPRWYWTDRRLGSATRTVRLVYQPLTQRWRLSVQEGDALNDVAAPGALHRSFDTLGEALALARTVQRWRIAPATGLRGDERLEVEFRIDTGQLPRPLQILPGPTSEPPSGWRAVLAVPAPPAGEAAQTSETHE
ncbi:MAG: DUF4390 domain-containing protein [Tepidimonas sp.]|uniref:DUF4390 domain-containing protein n=1 Tax=Tepidimonas sp. TaxID=2002775 RepID=UPI004054BA6F